MSPDGAWDLELKMRTLMAFQLLFEAVGRVIGAQLGEDAYAPAAEQRPHQKALSTMELYVRRVVEDWEEHDAELVASGYAHLGRRTTPAPAGVPRASH